MSGRRSVPPAPIPEDRYAPVFEARVVPAFWAPFGKRLVEAISARLAKTGRILELGSAAGHLTVDLQKLVPDGRVVAIEPRRALVDLARGRAGDLGGRKIFFKSEPIDRTTFADGAFDAVVSNLGLEVAADPSVVVPEMRRLVAPGGVVALSALLAGSWSVVLDVFGEVIERFEFPGAAERLEALRARMPSAADVAEVFERAGLVEVSVVELDVPLRFRNARELFRDEVVRAGPLAAWKAIAGDDATWERAFFHVRETMDTYFVSAEAIEVPLRGAVAMGTRPSP